MAKLLATGLKTPSQSVGSTPANAGVAVLACIWYCQTACDGCFGQSVRHCATIDGWSPSHSRSISIVSRVVETRMISTGWRARRPS